MPNANETITYTANHAGGGTVPITYGAWTVSPGTEALDYILTPIVNTNTATVKWLQGGTYKVSATAFSSCYSKTGYSADIIVSCGAYANPVFDGCQKDGNGNNTGFKLVKSTNLCGQIQITTGDYDLTTCPLPVITFGNTELDSAPYTRNNCPVGQTGGAVTPTYTILANTYFASTQSAANNTAVVAMQDYVNTNALCTAINVCDTAAATGFEAFSSTNFPTGAPFGYFYASPASIGYGAGSSFAKFYNSNVTKVMNFNIQYSGVLVNDPITTIHGTIPADTNTGQPPYTVYLLNAGANVGPGDTFAFTTWYTDEDPLTCNTQVVYTIQ